MKALVVLGLTVLAVASLGAQQDDRWQVTLNDGRIIWELHLVHLRNDTLFLRGSDSTYRFPIGLVDELRLVVKSVRHQTPEPNRYGGVLGGADDEVYRLTLYSIPERRAILEQVLKNHPPNAVPESR
ncbi:MAG TPA: hypothetical protein VM716_10095 [Gemmatimonadales bacterium]|nr:hypothetical protein [Gemmatimonadales bacterium]